MAKYQVTFTPVAKEKLEEVKAYILQHHTKREYNNLLKEIKRVKKILEKGNVDFWYSKKKNAYRVVLHKYSSMNYIKHDNKIKIVWFWDNRMDWRKNPYSNK